MVDHEMVRTLFLAVLVIAATARADPATYRHDVRVARVAPGIHVASRPEPLRSYVEGNATIIINERDVVVVDASGSPGAARKVIEAIRTLTPNPVRYVVLTHIHRDHRFGLQEYVAAFPGLEIIAHPRVKEVIDRPSSATFVADTIARLEKQRENFEKELKGIRDERVIAFLRRYYEIDLPEMIKEYRSIRNIGPTATVDEKLVLHRSSRQIEILFLGHGDTDHDLVVYLPHEKVVVTGDMVVHPFPYGFSERPREWLKTLRKLSALDFETLVPGHRDVQKGKTYLYSVIALIESVHAQVAKAIAERRSLDETRADIDLSAFEAEMTGDDPIRRYLFHDYFEKPAVEQAYRAVQK